jgi:hypothetical protein
MLNSLWGKLAQRPNQPQTKVVSNFAEMWNLINNPHIEILGDIRINDMLIYNYQYIEDHFAKPGNTSVAIAAFVTSYARLKLYDEIEKIEESRPGSVLYMDNDSIIFVHKGQYRLNVANFLGEMTDEITEEFGLRSRMTEFYTCGPRVPYDSLTHYSMTIQKVYEYIFEAQPLIQKISVVKVPLRNQ